MDGNNATPGNEYHLTKRHTPWIDADGNSVTPILGTATAQGLELLRPLTNSMEAAAAAAGIDHEDIILSYTVQTQSITPTLKLLRSIAQPAATTIAPLGITTAVLGAPGIADVYQGIITLPYYLGAPTPENPVAPLREFWTAPPGGYIPPYDQFGLDPTSTHITAINPFPVLKSMQSVPVLLTVPNAGSGMVKPDNGWPVVIFLHGLGWNRGAALLVADTFASIGYAVIAIDAPLHGTHPVADPSGFGFLYIENMPFGAVADERTFDMDFINNTTSAPGPDGIPDGGGTFFVNLQSLLTTRDNARQGVADLSVLAVTIPTISFDGDNVPDLDGTNIAFTGWSGGAMLGLEFLAIEPTVTRGVLSVPGGGIARLLTNSEFYGPIFNGQLAGAGLLPGTADYELFLTVWQTAVDSADPLNWALEAVASNRILANEVINDDTIPNFVLTAPLSGTEPLLALMGLQPYSSTIANPEGLQVVGRFLPPAIHSGLVNPEQPAITAEMQGQMASFIASFGTLVNVTNEATMVQVLGLSEMLLEQPNGRSGSTGKGRKRGGPIIGPDGTTRVPYRNLRGGLNND
jgi:hypothetical protein